MPIHLFPVLTTRHWYRHFFVELSMNIMPFTLWRQSPPTGHAIFSGQRDGLLCLVCRVESSERWGAHKGMVTSDTACECLVTSELSCMLLSQHHTIQWPVGQDYVLFSHAGNGVMEFLVALLSLSLCLSPSLSLSLFSQFSKLQNVFFNYTKILT